MDYSTERLISDELARQKWHEKNKRPRIQKEPKKVYSHNLNN